MAGKVITARSLRQKAKRDIRKQPLVSATERANGKLTRKYVSKAASMALATMGVADRRVANQALRLFSQFMGYEYSGRTKLKIGAQLDALLGGKSQEFGSPTLELMQRSKAIANMFIRDGANVTQEKIDRLIDDFKKGK